MSEPELPDEARAELMDESSRSRSFWRAFLRRWPNFRKHAAIRSLAESIALADSVGIDVEGFLASLRAREPKPTVLVPQKGS